MPTKPYPESLPIFPLTGVLLLPGMWLPLNIFEPRYVNMIRDVLTGNEMIGMVQPMVPRQDNAPPPEVLENPGKDHPDVYPVGCMGKIKEWKQQDGDRYSISLLGISRFRIRSEYAPNEGGYRVADVDYGEFPDDQEDQGLDVNVPLLLEILGDFGKENHIPFDTKRLETVSGSALVNGLSMSLPFGAAEKQALLEASGIKEREALLFTLMGMGLKQEIPGSDPNPTLN